MLNDKKRFISWIPVLIWMIIIFLLSSQPAGESNQLSKGFTSIIIEILGRFLHLDIEVSTINNYVVQFNHYVRKFAHFSAYLVLGLLASNAFIKSSKEKKKAFIYTFIFCVLYAISDELHQQFVPGRGPMLKDVMIDSAGAAVGIVLYKIGYKYKRRTVCK